MSPVRRGVIGALLLIACVLAGVAVVWIDDWHYARRSGWYAP